MMHRWTGLQQLAVSSGDVHGAGVLLLEAGDGRVSAPLKVGELHGGDGAGKQVHSGGGVVLLRAPWFGALSILGAECLQDTGDRDRVKDRDRVRQRQS